MEVFQNVEAIRITNEKSRLLIMKDYVPIIGDIDGKLEVIGQNNMVYENVKGIIFVLIMYLTLYWRNYEYS